MNGRRRTLLHLALVAVCLASPAPFHALLHAQPPVELPPLTGVDEIHDGDCEHVPEHLAHDECATCKILRGQSSHHASSSAKAPILDAATHVHDSDDVTPDAVLPGTPGARAPPARG